MIRNNRGVTLIEAMILASVFIIAISAIVQSQVFVSKHVHRTKRTIILDSAVSDTLNMIRNQAQEMQSHFANYTQAEIDLRLAYDKLPYTFDEKGVRPKEECAQANTCVNRLGYLVLPLSAVPGVFKVQLKIFQWQPSEQKYLEKDLSFVFGR